MSIPNYGNVVWAYDKPSYSIRSSDKEEFLKIKMKITSDIV